MLKKNIFSAIIALAVTICSAAGAQKSGEMKKTLPEPAGKSGPAVLILNGERPRMGYDMRDLLVNCGAKVTTLSGEYLAGLSGASIKRHLGDKIEPVPFDGITPAFANLNRYKLVLFHQIKAENLKKLFTPARENALSEYVKNGGNVLFTADTPAGILEDIMPVKFGKMITTDEAMRADLPQGRNFRIFPDYVPCFRIYREAVPQKDAAIWSYIYDSKGTKLAPFIATIKIGKGSVTFLNAEKINPKQFKEFSNWAYCRAFFAAVMAECAGLNIDCSKELVSFENIPERKTIDSTTLDITQPAFEIRNSNEEIKIRGRSATFASGAKISVNANGSVNMTFPGKKTPYIRNFRIPEIAYSEIKLTTGSLTYEADDLIDEVKAADIKWQFKDIYAVNNTVTVRYEAKGSILDWEFKTGKMNLDGREYTGIAERVNILKCPLMINQVTFNSELTLPDPLFARRMSCYSPPRGYSDFPMDGSVKKADTFTWNYLGSGQPFELIACKNGVYLAHTENAFATTPRLIRISKEKFIRNSRFHQVGRVKAPEATDFYWHWFSDGKERGHHEYLAIYQFLRRKYRLDNDLKELPVYPMTQYGYQLTADEQKKVIESAVSSGYRFIHPPMPETPIEKMIDPQALAAYEKICKLGGNPHVWSAGSYVQGDGGWIINNHPEWFVKTEKGKIFSYAGNYPVIDVNNEEFYQWYTKEIMSKAIAAGVRWVYRDMDGAAARMINHAVPESPYGMKSQIRFYKFFHDNGCRVSIEGMNPLAIDEYWYRADKYTSFAGNEFSLIGQAPNGDIKGGLTLDPFRTGMYSCFPSFEFSGTTFNFDRIVGETARGKRAASFVPEFNKALDFTGMPYIRETDFGTVWYGKGGAVMFFWNPVKKLTVNLPGGWKIRGVEGNVLTDVKGDSITYIDRK